MGDWLDEIAKQLKELPAGRLAVLALTTVGSLAFFGWLIFGAAAPDYRALYRGLPEAEIAQIADALLVEKIDYRIDGGGTTILVPANEIAEARMRMAGRGLPSGGNNGFELFDSPAFGVTDFVHRVNYVRAVQGELARSIEQLDPVDRARVQVVIPERGSVLARAERKPRASAVLKLHPGRELDAGQVRAVVHLIASGLEGLDPSDVTVVDGSGRLLAPVTDSGPGSAAQTAGVSGYQQRIETELSQRIESILERTVGPDNVVAHVRADLDWTESETTEEVYDPDSQVARSEQRSVEQTNEEPTGGVPGVAANVPGGDAPTTTASVGSSQETETINYEISKSVSRKVVPMGRVERLSIAVLVADPVAPTGGTAGGEDVPEGEVAPWSAEDLELFESLARQAAGFDAKRGDQITVRSAPFRTPTVEVPFEAPSFWPQWSPLLLALLKGALALVALLLFARLVVKPLAGTLAASGAAAGGVPHNLPARLADVESEMGVVGGGTAAAIGPGPETEDAARALRNWLNQS